MPSGETYVCDADCPINLHRHFGRQAIRKLEKLGKRDRLKIPEGVIREIERRTDSLARFVKAQRQHLEVSARQIPALHSEIPRLERLYGDKIRVGTQEYNGFWRSAAGRKSADSQVVAVAKLKGGVVVSDDRAVKLVCALENVPCIGWSEFARRLNLSQQPDFDL